MRDEMVLEGLAGGMMGAGKWTPHISRDRFQLRYTRRRKRMSCKRFFPREYPIVARDSKAGSIQLILIANKPNIPW